MQTTNVQRLVDVALHRARRDCPGVEYSIPLSGENSLLLPRHSEALQRVVDGRAGSYAGHVYRDALV